MVVECQRQLGFFAPRQVQEVLIERPPVRSYSRHVADAGLVLTTGAIDGQHISDRLFRSGHVPAQGDEFTSTVGQPFGVRIGVLHHDTSDPLRVPLGLPEPHRCAEAEHLADESKQGCPRGAERRGAWT